MPIKKTVCFILVSVFSCLAAAYAAEPEMTPQDVDDHAFSNWGEANDPFESVNRAVYKFNDVLDRAILKPVVKGYRFVVPEPGRKGVRNVLNNMLEPINFLNSALQGKQEKAFTSFWRFTVNTTWGIGGLFDVADIAGLHPVSEDFGQTLGHYGVGPGPYIVWPLLGPSSGRDTVGKVADAFSDPFNYWFNEYGIATRMVVSSIDTREALLDVTDEIDRVALDPYATLRSMYLQKRYDLVHDGKKRH